MKKKALIESSPVKQITVLLAENHAVLRKSLKLLVELDKDIKIIGEAKNGFEAVKLTGSLHPEVVVMDIAMPLLNGLQAAQQIKKTFPATKVLVLTAHSEPEYITQAVLCGASGYLIKQSSTRLFAQAAREVFKGNTFFCAPIAKPLRDGCRKLLGKGDSSKKKVAR